MVQILFSYAFVILVAVMIAVLPSLAEATMQLAASIFGVFA